MRISSSSLGEGEVIMVRGGGVLTLEAMELGVQLGRMYVDAFCDALGLRRVPCSTFAASVTVELGHMGVVLEGASVGTTVLLAWLRAATSDGVDMGGVVATGHLPLSGEVCVVVHGTEQSKRLLQAQVSCICIYTHNIRTGGSDRGLPLQG